MKGITKNRISEVSKIKTELLRELSIPEDALPGSLTIGKTRCGKKGCHCSESGGGHAAWSFTYMKDGRKQVHRIPTDLAEYVQEKIRKGKHFKEGINQIFLANADLLLLRKKRQKN